jgi:protein-S-isoprenylcysteine O-methyltransferase Ste14
VRTVFRQVLSPLILGAFMFALAGTTDWLWGWVFTVVHTLVWIALTAAVWLKNREVLNVRGKPQAGTKSWDTIALSVFGLSWLVMLLLAPLDVRYGWTAPLPIIVHVVGNGLIIVGFALLTWSMVANRHFEATVRLQTERDHHVITGGPYRYVRHPGYVGTIIAFYFGMPLALGSLPMVIPALIGLVTLVIRTALEDSALQAELPGYVEFAQQTRYRLLPGVW